MCATARTKSYQRGNLRSEAASRSPQQRALMGTKSFQPPKPHKNELNNKIYDRAGEGMSVQDLTDSVEFRTKADEFFFYGEKERVKCSKLGMNYWKPGVKVRDMYTYGFKNSFNKTHPKFGFEFYSTSE